MEARKKAKKKADNAAAGCLQAKQAKKQVEKAAIEDGADETWVSLQKLIKCVHSKAYCARRNAAILDGESQAKHFNIVVFYADMPWS